MYYFDKTIERYESTYCFSDSLVYLIKLYENLKTVDLLNSIIAFSWYYLIEGPVDSGRFENEDTSFSLETWKKYVEYVIGNGNCEPSTLYFCGYTLSLHGFLIGKDMEFIGKKLINNALSICKEEKLKELIMAFVLMDNQKKYKPIKLSKETLLSLFEAKSMVGKYFLHLYK